MIDRDHTSDTLEQMAKLARNQAQRTVNAFASRDEAMARQLEPQNDAIDQLNRQVFDATLRVDAASDQRGLAMRYVLIARSLERIGDNAVDIGEHAAFVVCAELQELSTLCAHGPPRPVAQRQPRVFDEPPRSRFTAQARSR